MSVELKLPELGEGIDKADVVSVLVAVGDTITDGQPVLEIETDKATAEVPAVGDGTVTAIHVEPGDTLTVGQTLMSLGEAGAAPAAPAPEEATEKPAVPAAEATAEAAPLPVVDEPAPEPAPAAPPTEAQAPPLGDPAPAAPSVRRLARELGVDIDNVPGSGPSGRISKDDVKAHAKARLELAAPAAASASAPAAASPRLPDFSQWGPVERQTMTGIRRATARAMATSWSLIPHVTQADRADVTELDAWRRRYGKKTEAAGVKLTMTAIVLKLTAAALRKFPKLNASLDMENEEVVLKHYVHLGVAVDTEHGLLVPVIRNADQKALTTVAAELNELADKARRRKLDLASMQGGSFSVTNLGGLGTTNFTPIVTWPQVAVLGVGRASTEPVWKGEAFEPRLIMPLSLSYDHRMVDGADAARFLRWLAEALEQPLLALEAGA